MKQTILHELQEFRLVSHGNGLAYELINKESCRSIFLQGDDAGDFRDELEELSERLDYREALRILWNDYATVSQPWNWREKA